MHVQERSIDVGRGRSVITEFKVFGETSPNASYGAVFANGFGCPQETTESPAAALAEAGFQIVTFEPDPTAHITTRDRVAVMKWLGENVLGAYVAMGFGLGGDVAARVACQDYEDNGRDVVGLIDIAGSHDESDRFLTREVARVPAAAFGVGIGLTRFLDTLRITSERQSTADYAAHVSGMSPEELAAYHFAARDSMREADEGGSLDNLFLYHGGPSFYIHGASERADYLPDIKAHEHITEVEIPDAWHFLHADAPKAYIAALTRCMLAINDH